VAWRVADIQALVDDAPVSVPGSYGFRRFIDVELAWRRWFASLPATHAVSLAYNNILKARPGQIPVTRRIPTGRVRGDINRLHRDLDRHLLGRRYTAPNVMGRRTDYVGFIENADDNLHVHLLWTVPVHRGNEFEEFRSLIQPLWRELTEGYGSTSVDLIRDAGWAEYTLKDQFSAALEDPDLFVFGRSPG
jgi:hypothetical protein